MYSTDHQLILLLIVVMVLVTIIYLTIMVRGFRNRFDLASCLRFFLRAALISCMRSLLIDFVLILEKNLLDYHADCGVDCCDFGDCNTNC